MSLTKRFLQDVFEEQQMREWEEGRGYYFHIWFYSYEEEEPEEEELIESCQTDNNDLPW
ncbi:hypothetical protein Rm378p133 [Rhodothermus phage RM378]|uniref:hypothetical protein n=1 Tax=Rhodothermus phage RM378 TaxID=148943 RepID=UPI000018F685|nr:hypothetical protein Rm378p133 [Rhodothermus phage RM378]